MDKVRVRFAPSPTGLLHVGNARTALFNWLFARQEKGVFILRIEDTDIERSAEEYEKRLMEDLRWLGLDWDEGPDVGGSMGPYRQSLRLEQYRYHTQKLLEEGKAYYCFCSPEILEDERKKAISAGMMPVYAGRCRSLPRDEADERLQEGEKAAVRLVTPGRGELVYHDLVRGDLSFDLELVGDPILVRSNGHPAYNFAATLDDALMKITHVIRGEDHISNTPRQLLIYRALSFAAPEFAHLSMVMGSDSMRLSKRHGATAVDQFRKDGILPAALFNYLALLGWASPDGREVLLKEELVQLFNLKKVSRSSAIFDYDKLHWLNREYIKKLSSRQKAELAVPYLQEAELLAEEMTEDHWKWLEKAVEAYIERVDRFSDIPGQVAALFDFSPQAIDEEIRKELKSECALKVIRLFRDLISRVERFDEEKFNAFTKEIRVETGCKGRDLYHPLRLTLTARSSGLDLNKFIPLVEEGAQLDFPKILKSCSQRVSEMVAFLRDSGFYKEDV